MPPTHLWQDREQRHPFRSCSPIRPGQLPRHGPSDAAFSRLARRHRILGPTSWYRTVCWLTRSILLESNHSSENTLVPGGVLRSTTVTACVLRRSLIGLTFPSTNATKAASCCGVFPIERGRWTAAKTRRRRSPGSLDQGEWPML